MEKEDARHKDMYDTVMAECEYWKNAAEISENNAEIFMAEGDELKVRLERQEKDKEHL